MKPQLPPPLNPNYRGPMIIREPSVPGEIVLSTHRPALVRDKARVVPQPRRAPFVAAVLLWITRCVRGAK